MAHILLMEDDFFLSQEYKADLEQLGHQVTLTSNATEALDLCHVIVFDIAIVDIFVKNNGHYTPDGGLLLIGKLRSPMNQSLFRPSQPIIAISGIREGDLAASILKTALQVGANISLPKPIYVPELNELVLTLLQEYSKTSE